MGSSRRVRRRRPPRRGEAVERPALNPGASDQLLRLGLGRIGLQATPDRLEAFALYRSELLRWATRVNLTGFRTEGAIVREGFLRSLSYRVAFEPAPGMRALDIGSGAGFPGLVLKICYPEIDMVLVEAGRRRATFLRSLIRQLGLTGVRCLHARAERLVDQVEHRGRYQVAFARAVGPPPEVLALAEPLLAPGGRLVLQVGQRTARSLVGLRPRLASFGLKAALCESPALDQEAPPTELLVVEKPSSATPDNVA